jgi:hypothetical protein
MGGDEVSQGIDAVCRAVEEGAGRFKIYGRSEAVGGSGVEEGFEV